MSDDILTIGISACFMPPDPNRNLFRTKQLLYMEEQYAQYVMRHGALPLMLPTSFGTFDAEALVSRVDGLMLQGGSDIAPGSYGESPVKPEWAGDAPRDAYELELIRACLRLGKPVLGVCRGMQFINVALGGNLHQDIKTDMPEAETHRDADLYDGLRHRINIERESGLARLYPDCEIALVNSIHHQGVKDLAPGLKIEARSREDGIVEAIRLADVGPARERFGAVENPWVFGVQWHPEFHDPADGDLLDSGPILREFLAEARERRGKRPTKPI